jgi:muramoyltetrapeptide carboxypeptidase LdcA involved in peptidoglycan recycling
VARPALNVPRKPVPGDRVAIVSPSFAAPAVYPAVHDLAMDRLRTELGVIPVEYPTTRRRGASPRDRAADLMAAFGDPAIRAVMATIGGDDQIAVLPHLDLEIVVADPKPFFGYSDNTNLLNWLWNAGIVGCHGGSTMVHLGRGAGLHPVSTASLRSALFTHDEVQVTPVDEFSEDEVSWATPEALTSAGPVQPSDGWSWHNADRAVSGPTWGGNLEVLHWNLAAGRWIRPADDYAGCILLLETSEEMPSATEVLRMLRNFGERGLLAQFPAVVVGRPKASSRESPRTPEERAAYRSGQRAAVLEALEAYNPGAMVVFGLDFGHTDPQWIIPYGGTMRIDGPGRIIHVRY